MHDIPGALKEECLKKRVKGKETAPVKASENAMESEANYTTSMISSQLDKNIVMIECLLPYLVTT